MGIDRARFSSLWHSKSTLSSSSSFCLCFCFGQDIIYHRRECIGHRFSETELTSLKLVTLCWLFHLIFFSRIKHVPSLIVLVSALVTKLVRIFSLSQTWWCLHRYLEEELVAVICLNVEHILYPCPILLVTSSMGIGFDQISENGPDPNRSDRPVEEEKQKKRKKSTKEMSRKNYFFLSQIWGFMQSGIKYIDWPCFLDAKWGDVVIEKVGERADLQQKRRHLHPPMIIIYNFNWKETVNREKWKWKAKI